MVRAGQGLTAPLSLGMGASGTRVAALSVLLGLHQLRT